MKTEIKEILEDIKEHSDSKNATPFELIDIECQLLLDYITNLQKENKEQKKQLESLIAQLELYKDNEEYLNNKIDKAIKYIEQDYDKNEEVIDYCNFDDFYKNVVKILKGE